MLLGEAWFVVACFSGHGLDFGLIVSQSWAHLSECWFQGWYIVRISCFDSIQTSPPRVDSSKVCLFSNQGKSAKYYVCLHCSGTCKIIVEMAPKRVRSFCCLTRTLPTFPPDRRLMLKVASCFCLSIGFSPIELSRLWATRRCGTNSQSPSEPLCDQA